MHTLEEVSINVKLLTEMLSHYNKDSSSESDKEIIKVWSLMDVVGVHFQVIMFSGTELW